MTEEGVGRRGGGGEGPNGYRYHVDTSVYALSFCILLFLSVVLTLGSLTCQDGDVNSNSRNNNENSITTREHEHSWTSFHRRAWK